MELLHNELNWELQKYNVVNYYASVEKHYLWLSVNSRQVQTTTTKNMMTRRRRSIITTTKMTTASHFPCNGGTWSGG